MENDVLLEEVSPHGNVEAIVEEDGKSVYFYLRGAPDTGFEVKSCWVRNLAPAPASLDVEAMKGGHAPMLPRDQCRHPQGAPRLDKQSLRVIWFEEGDGAALATGDDILAIIPPWSGTKGFSGYAKDCSAETPVAWPLLQDNALLARVRRAGDYWSSWGTPESPWKRIQQDEMAAYERAFGKYEKYFAIDGNEWPPKALVRYSPDRVVLITVGVAIRPQPAVEMATKDASAHRRIELAITLEPKFAAKFADRAARYISAQSSLPWARMTWLGHGHTVPCDAFEGTPFVAVMLVSKRLGVPAVQLPRFREDPINVLWLVPLTRPEYDFAMQHASDELLDRFERASITHVASARRSVL